MRRRDLLRSIGSSVVILSAASGRAIAAVESQREAAIDNASNNLGVDEEHLDVLVEAVASWPTLGEDYYQAKVHDSKNNRMHRALIDGDGEKINRDQLNKREEQAYREQYGKFTPRFSEKLSNADSKDTFEVEVRLKPESINRRNPVRNAVESTNDDTDTKYKLKEKLSEVRTDKVKKSTNELANKLSDLPSIKIITKGEGASIVVVESTKEDLEKVANIDTVWRISDMDTPPSVPDQRSATRTMNIADDSGPYYDLSGVPIGVLEIDHPYQWVEANIAGTRYNSGDHEHPTRVTECAASTDDAQPGAAYNADVYFADNYGAEHPDNFVSYFADNDATAFNLSASTYYCDRILHQPDLAFEESVFNHNMNFCTSSGNSGYCDDLNVSTPAKGFNSIAVGAIDDNDTGDDRSDDELWDNSCRINPETRNSDDITYPHQKPELSGVGANIKTPWNTFEFEDGPGELSTKGEEENPYEAVSGTSYSSPNVTGAIAILEDQFGGIANAPDTAKAVLMASATHDLGSYTRDEHGAGCIDVDSALYDVLFSQQFITDIFSESNSSQDYSINLTAGDTVDIALVWRSDATQTGFSNNEAAQSDINLDLNFYDTAGNLIAYDGRYDRAWQLIEGDDDNLSNQIDETGTYQIKIWNDRWDAESSDREFTIAWRIY